MMIFITLLKNRIKRIAGLARNPIQFRTAYLAVCCDGDTFETQVDKTLNHVILYPVSHVPQTPYAKVKIDIIELNPRYGHER